MSDFEIKTRVVGPESPEMAAAIVTGYGGNIAEFEDAAQALSDSGHHTVLYQYGDDFLKDGDPSAYPALIEEIRADFGQHTEGIDTVRICGVSLGTAIGVNLQKADERSTLPALYASGGNYLSRVVWHHPYFIREKHAFKRNGVSSGELFGQWETLHEAPNKPLVVALGGLDYVIRYDKARRWFKGWREQGSPSRVLTVPFAGHRNIQKWFNNNIPTMIDAGKEYELAA